MGTITTSSIWRSYPGATVVALLLGYFVLGLSIGGGSVWLGLHYFGAYHDPFHHWILFIFFFGSGAAILVSLVPRPIAIKIEGLEIKPQEQPRLFEMVNTTIIPCGANSTFSVSAEFAIWGAAAVLLDPLDRFVKQFVQRSSSPNV